MARVRYSFVSPHHKGPRHGNQSDGTQSGKIFSRALFDSKKQNRVCKPMTVPMELQLACLDEAAGPASCFTDQKLLAFNDETATR
jgi:hypothetical protein